MLQTRALFEFVIEVAPPVLLGDVEGGTRRVIPLGAGVVSGAFSGRVLPGGADWQTVRSDGALEISAHYLIERDDGARVEVSSNGVRTGPPEVLERLARGEPVPASAYYFRTHMRFCSAAPDLIRLNHVLAVSQGERSRDAVKLRVFEVL